MIAASIAATLATGMKYDFDQIIDRGNSNSAKWGKYRDRDIGQVSHTATNRRAVNCHDRSSNVRRVNRAEPELVSAHVAGCVRRRRDNRWQTRCDRCESRLVQGRAKLS